MTRRYSPEQIQELADRFAADGFLLLPQHFPRAKLEAWNAAFRPLLDEHIAAEGHLQNRGAARYYVTLPFEGVFADPEIFEDEDLLALVERIVGADPVMCQLATDTPLRGSDYQDIHRDTPPLFPEWGRETPSYQLAVNFPLIDVTPAHGPVEIARGTHVMSRDEGMAAIESGTRPLEPFPMQLGDAMIRDVRHLHRGTPNRTDEPRPMVVIGYSRKWLFRPEVHIRVPRATRDRLSERARRLLRFNPVVESLDADYAGESYQSFAY